MVEWLDIHIFIQIGSLISVDCLRFIQMQTLNLQQKCLTWRSGVSKFCEYYCPHWYRRKPRYLPHNLREIYTPYPIGIHPIPHNLGRYTYDDQPDKKSVLMCIERKTKYKTYTKHILINHSILDTPVYRCHSHTPILSLSLISWEFKHFSV